MSFREKTQHFEEFLGIGERLLVNKGVDIVSLDKKDRPSVYALIKGVCCLTKMTHEGEEVNYIYFYEGQMMRLVSCMLQDFHLPKDRFSIISKTPCVVQQIEFDVFKKYLRENIILAESIMGALSARLGHVILGQHSTHDKHASLRLCEALLEMSVPYKDGFILEPGFTYGELAKYLRVHVVTVSRIMMALKKKNVIDKDKRKVLIDVEKLQKIIQDQEVFRY